MNGQIWISLVLLSFLTILTVEACTIQLCIQSETGNTTGIVKKAIIAYKDDTVIYRDLNQANMNINQCVNFTASSPVNLVMLWYRVQGQEVDVDYSRGLQVYCDGSFNLYVANREPALFTVIFNDQIGRYESGFVKLEDMLTGSVSTYQRMQGLQSVLTLEKKGMYQLTLCTRKQDDCRSVAPVQYNDVGYATYTVRYPPANVTEIRTYNTSVYYKVWRDDVAVYLEWETLQGTTNFVFFTIYDSNKTKIYEQESTSQSGRITYYTESDEALYVVVDIVNTYQSILGAQFILIKGEIPTELKDWAKKIPSEFALIMFGGLLLFTVLLFKKTLTSIGMVLTIVLLGIFKYYGIITLSMNTILVLAVIAGLVFFAWFRERVWWSE